MSNSNYDNSYNDDGGYHSSAYKKERNVKSLSRQRMNTSGAKNLRSNTGAISLHKAPIAPLHNDFDIDTVNDGLAEIDVLLNQLEADVPDDVYESEEMDIDSMMKANHLLRDRVNDIAHMVINAIKKAVELKKKIITHRDEPTDPEIKSKMNTIKSYQAKISSYKRKIKALNIKIENATDNDRISSGVDSGKLLDAEIKELERQK